MKIDTISYTEKFNKGNYESVEVGFSAALNEDESAIDALYNLKTLAHNFFATINNPQPVAPVKEEVKEEVKEKPKAKKSKKVVEEKSKSEKIADVVDGQEVPPVIPPSELPPTEADLEEEMEEVESPYSKPSNHVVYDLKNKDHRDRLAAYLNKTYPTWKSKPKAELLAMSQELSGKEFEDSKAVMLDSFKNIVSTFFE